MHFNHSSVVLIQTMIGEGKKTKNVGCLFVSIKGDPFKKLPRSNKNVPMFFSLFQDDRLHQRFGITEGDDGQHMPPLPPRTSYERTVTVVRGNRSLGMFSMFLVVMLSWCVYIVGMAVMTLLGSGDYNYHEDKW